MALILKIFVQIFPILKFYYLGLVRHRAYQNFEFITKKMDLIFPQIYECDIVASPNLTTFQYKGTTFQLYLAPPSDTSKILESSILYWFLKFMNKAWFLKLRSYS